MSRTRRWASRIFVGVFAFGVLCVIWAFFIEPRRLVIHRVDLALPAWPEGQPALRVALLSDLHVGSPHWSLERLAMLVDTVNGLEPDIVLLAGDYTINGVWFGTHVDQEPIGKVLAGLRAKHGTVAVLGNHDWYNDGERTRRALEAHGIVVLENANHTFVHEGAPVTISGLADYVERTALPEQTFAAAPAGPVIALIHEPDIFGFRMSERPAVTLAGHTHGGQVALPLLGRPVVPSDFGQRYAAGHIVENGRHLFVTTGVGTSIYPVRFGVPPEIALLTIHAK